MSQTKSDLSPEARALVDQIKLLQGDQRNMVIGELQTELLESFSASVEVLKRSSVSAEDVAAQCSVSPSSSRNELVKALKARMQVDGRLSEFLSRISDEPAKEESNEWKHLRQDARNADEMVKALTKLYTNSLQ
jgi:hypothetical protein